MSTSSAKPVKQRRIDLNPSSADRWTTCTASPQFIYDNWDKVPQNTDTAFSQEGTTAHEVAAALLEGRKPRVNDKWHCPTPITPEMNRHAWDYMEFVLGLKESADSKLLVEQKLPLWYMPGRNAIVDVAVINENSLHVIDYKYGQGITVEVENNLQAIIYAYSIGKDLLLHDDCPVHLYIYQPRGRSAQDSPYQTWQTTWKHVKKVAYSIELKAFAVKLSNAGSIKVEAKSLEFKPSEKACQWCPAKGFCIARANEYLGDLVSLDEVTNPRTPYLPTREALTTEQRAAVQKNGKMLIKWLEDVMKYNLTSMNAGQPLPGYKLVTSRGGNRYWINPKKAAQVLIESTVLRREEVITETTISPAEVEKLLGKNAMCGELMNLIGKPAGSPTIAPEADKRQSLQSEAASEFYDLDALTDVNDF